MTHDVSLRPFSTRDDWIERDGMALSLIVSATVSLVVLLAVIGGALAPLQGLTIPVAIFAVDLALFNLAAAISRRWSRSIASILVAMALPAAGVLALLTVLSMRPAPSIYLFVFATAFFVVMLIAPRVGRRLPENIQKIDLR
jgi:hypothetical protein